MDRFSDRGSTPLISTKSRRHPMRVPSAFELIWRESNGSVVNACQWHAEPTLTEPAGENSTPLISTKYETDCFGSPFLCLVQMVWMRSHVQVAR